MKKQLIVLLGLLTVVIYGCSRGAQEDVKELGNDVKRDVQKAARNVDDAAKDAMD